MDTSAVLLRVLLVEDCPDTATTTRQLLEFWGHDVRIATNGRAASKSRNHISPISCYSTLACQATWTASKWRSASASFPGIRLRSWWPPRASRDWPFASVLANRAVVIFAQTIRSWRSAGNSLIARHDSRRGPGVTLLRVQRLNPDVAEAQDSSSGRGPEC